MHNNPISDALGLRIWPVISSSIARAIGLLNIGPNLAPGTVSRQSGVVASHRVSSKVSQKFQ